MNENLEFELMTLSSHSYWSSHDSVFPRAELPSGGLWLRGHSGGLWLRGHSGGLWLRGLSGGLLLASLLQTAGRDQLVREQGGGDPAQHNHQDRQHGRDRGRHQVSLYGGSTELFFFHQLNTTGFQQTGFWGDIKSHYWLISCNQTNFRRENCVSSVQPGWQISFSKVNK